MCSGDVMGCVGVSDRVGGEFFETVKEEKEYK
jgi:hypothetical protein